MAVPAACKECGESSVYRRLDGIYECGCCGRMFMGEPKPLPAKIKGDWRPERGR